MVERVVIAIFLIAATCQTVFADWPAFRGPDGNGIATGEGYPTEWSTEQNVKWRTPLPGPGNGSPIVIGQRVFVLCAEDQGQQRTTYCLDRKDGKILWQDTVEFDRVEETHKTNPFCPSTPVSDGEHVYVWHRSAGMHCYDLEGQKIWSRDLGEFHHIWGGGSSPVLFQNMVIQLCGPGERTFLIALDKKTGETIWQTPNEQGGSASEKGKYIGTWCTPVLVDVKGQTQLLCTMHSRVVAYDPSTGEELWYITGLSTDRGDLAYTSPMVKDDYAVIAGGFGGPAFGIKLGGSGDMTDANRLWFQDKPRNPQRIGSGVMIGDDWFMANADNQGSIECVNFKTGEQLWKVKRTEDGPHWGSLILADGLMYVTGQNGITRVFKPNRDMYEEVAENNLGEQSNSTPAFSDGEIFLRTFQAVYCISKSP